MEIACLGSLAERYDAFLITESGEFGNCDDIWKMKKTYYVPQINRRDRNFFMKFFDLWKTSSAILHYEKPDVIVSTGALATVPACLLVKLHRGKVVYIESFARAKSPSLTGKLLYRFSDLFIVQWRSLLECYPRAIYGGGIF